MNTLREQLADQEHERWSGWMKYLFSKCTRLGDALVIPAGLVVRWSRQRATPYSELSEEEKDSDRKEADKTLKLINPLLNKAQEIIKEVEWEIDSEGGVFFCLFCTNTMANGHTDDCKLNMWLEELDG